MQHRQPPVLSAKAGQKGKIAPPETVLRPLPGQEPKAMADIPPHEEQPTRHPRIGKVFLALTAAFCFLGIIISSAMFFFAAWCAWMALICLLKGYRNVKYDPDDLSLITTQIRRGLYYPYFPHLQDRE